jgi:hypothetical protein
VLVVTVCVARRVKRDFSLIVQKVCTTGSSGSSSSSQQQTASDDSQHNTGLLPIISLVTSSLVDLRVSVI